MAGIAGLLVTSERYDSDFMLQKMSEAIGHRKLESLHVVKHNSSRCMIVGPRSVQGSDDDLIVIDRNKDLILSETTDTLERVSNIFGVVVIVIDSTGLSLLRTLDGTRTLYYGVFKDLFAFATERKSLWNIEITSVHVLEPGQQVTVPWKGSLATKKWATLEKPVRAEASREATLAVLQKTLLASFERLASNTSCAVLFSGGVDSSLAAAQTAKQCEKTILFTASTEGSQDSLAAMEAASLLGLPIQTIEMNSQILWEILPEVIYSIETSRQMDVEIALPFYLASRKAAEEGCSSMVSGQGPDELFAGYAKHIQTFVERGPDALSQQLWSELSVTHEANIERDERAIAAHGMESFFPYLDQNFVRASLSVPVEWKVNPDRTPQRKIIFRELAQLMGVPAKISNAPKNATQYSSGSSKALLMSVIEHVEEFKGMSKKKVSRNVQDVLDEIANEIQMPNAPKEERGLHLDLGPVRKFRDKRGSLSSSNSR
jgi:asparagine synthase (glutamine-hydrolysing)